MCGIAVIFKSENKKMLNRMMQLMKHRGPDDEGIFSSRKAALGHVRLSIIDLKTGKQPIVSDDGKRCIVLNGEIYNFRELRKNLEKKHKFKTKTDTEVILKLYEDEGVNCVNKLEGMFAFAIYDDGKIFLARDRVGIKPLYYGWKDGSMCFASEIKALLECDNITIFPPGNIYTNEKGFHTYYEIPRIKPVKQLEEVTTNVRKELKKAVRKRLVADVPVGIFLSGGLDSSIIAALMREDIKEIHSFAAGIDGSPDLLFAKQVADYLGTIHHEYVYDKEEMLKILPEVIYHLESFDAPLVRSSIPCYFVSRMTKDYVKVVLTGEGADEIFGGYHYLKSFEDEYLDSELYRITLKLHHSNLQRTDRMTMANSVEARVPFLDPNVIRYVFSLPQKYRKPDEYGTEKWILRKAFAGSLPEKILWREKMKFSQGAGSSHILRLHAESIIGKEEVIFERAHNINDIRNEEELLYYRIFRDEYGDVANPELIGRTKDFKN